jgi:trehalose 6-phosphate synthase/phosphatase
MTLGHPAGTSGGGAGRPAPPADFLQPVGDSKGEERGLSLDEVRHRFSSASNEWSLPRLSLDDDEKPKHSEAHLLHDLSVAYDKLREVRDAQRESANSHPVLAAWGPPSPVHLGAQAERLILVSRRLPFRLSQTENGTWKAELTATNQALQNLRAVHERMNSIWVGLSGTVAEPGHQQQLLEQLKEHRLLPIFLDPAVEQRFHAGFCRTVLWPLCHSSLPTTEDTIARHDADGDAEDGVGGEEMFMWQAYKAVNQHYADAIQSLYRDGDLIWIHDYHLMLLPQMLRNVLPSSAKISFYLHLPFPSSEIYRILPYREEILEGMLSADLLGFQTYDYARHFLSTVESLLEADCSPKGVEHNGHFANVAICPVGIDPEQWTAMTQTAEVRQLMERWRKQFKGRRLLLGVDGMDATKGLVHKLLAVEEMFDRDPKLAETVTFVQVCFTGSASSTGDMVTLENQIHGFVGRINSKLASIEEEGPIKYFVDTNLRELCAIYCLADVLVITPIRDGMNIVPFEYTICREGQGKLATVVLSEFAGCARSLGGAILVNPWNTTEMVDAMHLAMNMDETERFRRHSNMSSYVRNFTSASWSQRSIEQLREANEGGIRTSARLLHKEHVLQAYAYSRWRLLVFNLEGVLTKSSALPELLTIRDEIVDIIYDLAEDPCNMIVVKSPRGMDAMERLLGETNCVLAAEHGAFVRWGRHADWEAHIHGIDMAWKADVEPLLQYYTERTPGAVIEVREASIAWHYRDCDLGHGAWQAKQLHVSLLQASKGLHISVFAGEKVLEVMPQAVSSKVAGLLQLLVARMRQLVQIHLSVSSKDASEPQWSKVSKAPSTDPFHSSLNRDGFEHIVEAIELNRGEEQVNLDHKLPPSSASGIEWLQQSPSAAPSTHESSPEGIFDLNMQLRCRGNSTYTRASAAPENSAGLLRQHSAHWSTESATTHGSDELDKAWDIDFVLVVASGQDLNDENLFESMLQGSTGLGLEEFVEQVEQLMADDVDSQHVMKVDGESLAPFPTVKRSFGFPNLTMVDSALGSADDMASYDVSPPPPLGDRFGIVPEPGTPTSAPELSSRPNFLPLRAPIAVNPVQTSAYGFSPRTTMAEANMGGADEMRVDERIIRMGGVDLRRLNSGCASPMPSPSPDLSLEGLGLRSKSSKRAEIIAQSQFRPRKEYPPPAMLFRAIRAKLGDNYDKKDVPVTPTACWAMVLSTQEGRMDTWKNLGVNVVQETHLPDMDGAGTYHGSSSVERILKETYSRRRSSMGSPLAGVMHVADPLGPLPEEDGPDLFGRRSSSPAIPSPQDVVRVGTPLSPSRYRIPEPEAAPANLPACGLELPINSFSCTVGLKLSQATYYLKSIPAVAALLKDMCQISVADSDPAAAVALEDGWKVSNTPPEVSLYAVRQSGRPENPLHSMSDTNLQNMDIVMGQEYHSHSAASAETGRADGMDDALSFTAPGLLLSPTADKSKSEASLPALLLGRKGAGK